MCHTTKDNIVLTLRELMKERPLRKIKVQDVMKATGMTRQSFYYHFQDIYQVVEWEVDRKLIRKLSYQPEVDVFRWLEQVFTLLDEDTDFYRRVVKNVYDENLRRLFLPIITPYVNELLFNDPDADVDSMDSYYRYLSFTATEIIFHTCLTHINHRDQMNDQQSKDHLEVLCTVLRGIRSEMAAGR